MMLLFGLTPIQILAQNNQFVFKHITVEDGLSQNLVYAIRQDRNGFMWFGTQDGLNRYDGYTFTIFQYNPYDSTSIAGHEIRALFEDKAGNLWIGAAGLSRFEPMSETFVRFVHQPNNPNSLSNNNVQAICEDQNGALWIGTDDGLNQITLKQRSDNHRSTESTISFKQYRHDPQNPRSLSHYTISALLVDRHGSLWIGTNKGLNRALLTPDSGCDVAFVRYTSEAPAPCGIADDLITCLHEDRLGRLWIGTPSGLFRMNNGGNGFSHYPFPAGIFNWRWQGIIKAILDRADGHLWIGTLAGLALFDTTTGAYQFIPHDCSDPAGINDYGILCIYRDHGDVVWFGTAGKGINRLNPHTKAFVHYGGLSQRSPGQHAFSVVAMNEDQYGTLWISANNRLYHLDRADGKWREFESDMTPVGSMLMDRLGIIWFPTSSGLWEYDPTSRQMTRHRHNPDIDGTLPSDAICRVIEGESDAIWALTVGGMLCRFDRQSRRFTTTKIPDAEMAMFYSAYRDPEGIFWLGSDAGLIRFNVNDSSVHYYRNDPSKLSSLSDDVIYSILADPGQPQRFLWLGTAGGGLNRFDIRAEEFVHFTKKDGLPNDVIYGILPDRLGRLWLSTNYGLSVFDPQRSTFRNFDRRDGLQSNEFNRGAYFLNRKGEMFFGGINGLNAFYPDSIRDNPHAPPVVITDFQLAYQSVSFREPDSPLKQPLSETKEIRLAHDQNTIAFEFAALDFTEPVKNRYAYKLQDFNPQWVMAGTNRRATYTNLSPGAYVFQVKGANNDGVWNEKGTSIRIIIAPPFWKTWWAYAGYLILGIGAVIGIVKGRVRRLEKRTRELETAVQQRTAEVVARENQLAIQAEKLRELDRIKSSFFANISHEFRTPLTLILGPVQRLISEVAELDVKHELRRIQKNAGRLLRLVNQLLDLSKLESGKMSVQARRGNIVPLLQGITMSFASLAEQKQITLGFHSEAEEIVLYFDQDKIEKIFYNLLANAFKFTPEGGSVDVAVEIPSPEEQRVQSEQRKTLATPNALRAAFIQITVKDTGIGIPADRLPHIFDRFYQVDHSSTREHEGAGIGLSLVKELVTLHHGSVAVASVEKQGSTFTVLLPLGREAFDQDEISDSVAPTELMDTPAAIVAPDEFDGKISESTSVSDDPKCTTDELDTIVLVVEDHAEVRAYIREFLDARYRVIEAGDGAEGVVKAQAVIPDLVIGDVMMPRMDGYEMCQALKTDERTSHIPVILLTARAALEDKVAGLKTGADDYLTKPFEAAELLARVENLIALRRKLRERWKQTVLLKPGEIAATPIDQAFLEKALAVAEAHLSVEDFSIEDFAGQVGMSRSQLHRKLHALTNQSASLFLRSVRLQRAAQLLKQRAGTIAEITYRVGFSSQAYFTRCFREQFGCSPKEYASRVD
ncbi:MAG: two-component regulator propeller domain-containing protein [Candidatus Zhuqueibacterota bacterium]